MFVESASKKFREWMDISKTTRVKNTFLHMRKINGEAPRSKKRKSLLLAVERCIFEARVISKCSNG